MKGWLVLIMKKLLSLFLAFSILTGISAITHAIQPTTQELAWELKQAGILYGLPDGSFGLDNQFTRSEAIAVILRFCGQYELASQTTYRAQFDDVPPTHWAAPYVIYAYDNGITKGVSDTEFGPESYVSAKQFCTLILRQYFNEPQISPDTVRQYILTKTHLDIDMIDEIFAKDSFIRDDMVRIVHQLIQSAGIDSQENQEMIWIGWEGEDVAIGLRLGVQSNAWATEISDTAIVGEADVNIQKFDDGVIIEEHIFKLIKKGRATITAKELRADGEPTGNLVVYRLIVLARGEIASNIEEGKENIVRVGDVVVVALDENPTTGYDWSINVTGKSLAIPFPSNDKFVQGDDFSGIPGSGGIRIITFYAKEAGVAHLEFNYTRPWEGFDVKPIQTKKFTVIVEE